MMRLLDDDRNRPVNKVWIYLTEDEARSMAQQLATLFEDDRASREWHCHVESDDGRAKELTLALYDPHEESGDLRWRGWFKDDRWEPGMFEGSSA
jgi:hypothetical protein